MLYGAREASDDRVLGKAALLLATAALESNLVYLRGVALRLSEKRNSLASPQIRFLKGIDESIDENGNVAESPARQTLIERLQVIPSLLARTIDREYRLKTNSAAFAKLIRTIERRDAIVHPRWDRYVSGMGWWEAAEAIDAVELYLNSIASALHPYLVGYFPLLYTIPGHDHHEVAVGHRTYGKRGPKRKIATMDDVGIREVLSTEWMDSMFLIELAMGHPCEGDSDGSMLTRAALVLLYGMLDAQLAVVAQWRMRENLAAFSEAEILFLNEYAVGLAHDGEVWLGNDFQSFKKRIKAVPAILCRRVEGKEARVDLGASWGKKLIESQALRNQVMHSEFGKPLPRVTKQELVTATNAVCSYFEELSSRLPTTFQHMKVFLDGKFPSFRTAISKKQTLTTP